MPAKIKFIITFLVVLITILIFYKHYLLNELIKSIIILLIGSIMIFGLWILPEATGKIEENNEKNNKLFHRRLFLASGLALGGTSLLFSAKKIIKIKNYQA